MPAERWIGFGIVWLALLILTVDMIVAARGSRRASNASVAAVVSTVE
jgi:chloramphenicol-sensitive protein RarD